MRLTVPLPAPLAQAEEGAQQFRLQRLQLAPKLDIAGAIHVADALEHGRLEGLSPSNPGPALSRIDQDWLDRIGGRRELDGWIVGLNAPIAA